MSTCKSVQAKIKINSLYAQLSAVDLQADSKIQNTAEGKKQTKGSPDTRQRSHSFQGFCLSQESN